MIRLWLTTLAIAGSAASAAPVLAQAAVSPANPEENEALRELIARQQEQLDRQARQIGELRDRLDRFLQADGSAAVPSIERSQVPAVASAQPVVPAAPPVVAAVPQPPVPLERVGQAPEDDERPIELAVLESQGSVVTRKGQLTFESQLDYARSDRSRAVFRGIELVEAVLVGVFDINESRQDVLTGSAALRYGLTDRLEIGARIPFIARWDTSIVAPIAGSTNNDPAATIDNSVEGRGIGDLELSARYQVLDGGNGSPFLIANLQGVFPTGDDPFSIPRDTLGRASRAATGGGFYGISPSVTVIMPSDPVVLFGTLGYTYNLAKEVNTQIPPVNISYVDPGDAISISAGIGISFNQRTTLNLGYAHSWAFGTLTRTSLIEPTPEWPGLREATSRDLQIGRLLFGVTYRVTDRSSLNWSVDIGATEDAPDVRTTLRMPLVLLSGR